MRPGQSEATSSRHCAAAVTIGSENMLEVACARRVKSDCIRVMASTEADLESQAGKQAGKKGYTAPKGRPTTHNTGQGRGKLVSPVMEWLIAGIVFVAVLAGIFYFGRGLNSGGGGGQGGAIEAPATLGASAVAVG